MTHLSLLIYFCVFLSTASTGPLFIFSSTEVRTSSTVAVTEVTEVTEDLAWKDDLEELQDDDYEELMETQNSKGVRRKKQTKLWDHWGKWSSCSSSCGVGKMSRWRHCISEGCALGEKEAQIKSCSEQPCR
ncbi:unnamed protein product [Brassicogethes aeneus]|uniref:Uncharacterized protein n=1 Tax=Brassicogethes aeneus TaxID=1431903 RepID=A0A9P0B3R1_BRAAE|nr:unnamed protein product [Brassicogethes aeneus]